MTVTERRGRVAAVGAVGADAQALFEEARHRRRRRYVWGAATIFVLVCGLVLSLVFSIGAGRKAAPAGVAGIGSTATRHSVRPLSFSAAFVPSQVISASRKIWVLGSTAPGNLCAMAEVDPVSLRTTTFALPACGSYVAVGGGRIFLADGVFTGATDTTTFHIESFDTATGAAVVMAPVDVTTTGTGYAHMSMTYGEDSLWLTTWGSDGDVLQISPSTGAVVRTITEAPLTNGGGHPIVAGGGSGLWSAPGIGGPEVIDRLAPGSQTPVTVFTGSEPGGIWFLSVVGDRVWAVVASSRDEGRSFVTRLVALDGNGRTVLEVSFRQLGESAIVGSGDDLWALTSGAACTGRQRLWRINGRTGTLVATASFASAVVPCLSAFDAADFAAVGNDVFVLGAGDSPDSPAVSRIAT